MTTGVGVKTNFKDDAVALGAESQSTTEDETEGIFETSFMHEPNQSKLHKVEGGVVGLSGECGEFPECFFSYLKGERSYGEYLEYLGGDEESNTENGLPFILGNNYGMLLERIGQIRRRRKNLSQAELAIKALITEKREPKNDFDEFLVEFFGGFGEELTNPLVRAADIDRRHFLEFQLLNMYLFRHDLSFRGPHRYS